MMRPSRSASAATRLASRLDNLGIVFPVEGLGQEAERADRRLQLVADVGDEVAPDGLQAMTIGGVLDDRDRPRRTRRRL